MKKLFYQLLFLVTIFSGCTEQEEPGHLLTINSEMAKFTDKAQIEKLYSISLEYIDEYQISSTIWLDVDDKKRLYVLDIAGQGLHRFNSNGTYDKMIIQKGMQQEHIRSAENFCIYDDTLFVHDRFVGIKTFDLEGNFLQTYFLDKPRNKAIFKPIEKFFLSNERISEKEKITQSTWYLKKLRRDFKPMKRIAEMKTDFFQTPQFEPAYILCFDSETNTYFPISRDEYSITKYDRQGNLLLTFGRKYERTVYSEKTQEIYNRVFGKKIAERRMPKLATYPPVVRYLFVDEFDYIWVVVGEWNLEIAVSTSTNTTFDIFDKDGRFLYTFTTDLFGYRSLVKHRRLYSAPTGERISIDVYSISLPLTGYK